jgi:hypothetical protein
VNSLVDDSMARLIAMNVIALAARKSRPKRGTDLADVRRLLLQSPGL